MAAGVVSGAVRRLALSSNTAISKAGKRAIHSTGSKNMAGGGGGYSNDYLHAPHMYNITGMRNRKLKFGLGVFGVLAFGTAVPIFAVIYQQKKTSMG